MHRARGQRAELSAIERHLNVLQQLGQSPGSIYQRRRALARLSAALPVPLLEASAQDLAAWRAGLMISAGAVASYVAHVRGFYAWAAADGLRADNPAAGLPVPRQPRRLPRPIAEADLVAAVGQAPARIRPWLVLAGWAGLRATEIAGLRRECVLDSARPPVLLVDADAAKGRRERIVPLCDFALGELLAAGLPRSGWIFPRHDGRPGPNKPWLVSMLANQHLRELGIAATLHQLRHRFGTQAYQASRDLRAVQALLGHASPQTTAGYAASSNASAIAAVNALPVPPGQHLRLVRRIGGRSRQRPED